MGGTVARVDRTRKTGERFAMEPIATPFLVDEVAGQMALCLLVGLLVGFEREWAHKEVGVRTFAIVSLLGTLGTLAGDVTASFAFLGVLLTALLVNGHSLLKDRSLELTTSAAMMLTFVLGALIGQGHFFTGATGGILLTLLLAWKAEMARFAEQLQPREIRGAALLGLLSFVIVPLLPDRFIDRGELLNPRQAWITIVVVAGMGFVNYVLLRLFRARGLYYAAFLGGLVNSALMVVELTPLLRRGPNAFEGHAERVLFLPNVAMCLRNLLLLSLLAPMAASGATLPLLAMALAAAAVSLRRTPQEQRPSADITLPSPLAFRRVAKTGALFLLLAALGTVSQRQFGDLGFFAVSILGGFVSSASATATAASLANSGAVTPEMAGMATLLASIASAMGNLPLVWDQSRSAQLTRRLSVYTALCAAAGLSMLLATRWLAHD
jgi:uncharacterized membrane protein (DUF4010 family)